METARGNWDFLHVSTILSKDRSAAVLPGALVHSDDSVQGAAHRLSAERSSEWRAEIGKKSAGTGCANDDVGGDR